MNAYGKAGVAKGLLQGAERHRRIGLEDAARERRHERQDAHDERLVAADKRDRTRFDQEQQMFQRRWQAMQTGMEREGVETFVRMLESGVDPTVAVAEYNKQGISKIKPDTFQFDPESGKLRYENQDGMVYDGSLDEVKKLVETFKQPTPPEEYTLSPGDSRFRGRERIAHVPKPDKDGAGDGDLPADARMVEYLVGNGIAGDKKEAFALVRMSRSNPADAVMRYVEMAQKSQESAGMMPGVEGYKSPEQLREEAVKVVNQINQAYLDSFKNRGKQESGGLDDADRGRGLPGALGDNAEALGNARGPRRSAAGPRRGASSPQASGGDAPYPEGTVLRGPDGRKYVVRNGQPVPVEGQ